MAKKVAASASSKTTATKKAVKKVSVKKAPAKRSASAKKQRAKVASTTKRVVRGKNAKPKKLTWRIAAARKPTTTQYAVELLFVKSNVYYYQITNCDTQQKSIMVSKTRLPNQVCPLVKADGNLLSNIDPVSVIRGVLPTDYNFILDLT
ncbi:MAG: hypothetical protein ACKN9U_09955 [Pirellulaceae bacterium]